MIISSSELVRRNAAFAATGAFAGLPFPASDTLQVLGCVDSRVDPGDVLGLELGEGVVMRNIGGRITPAALRSWTLLGRLGQGQPPSGHLVILHHTGCGITPRRFRRSHARTGRAGRCCRLFSPSKCGPGRPLPC